MESLRTTVIRGLRDRQSDWGAAAKFAGIHRRTVARIVSGYIENPGVLTVEKLFDFIRKNPPKQ